MSRSKFQVTSFIDFQMYLDYFTNYKKYLNKFQKNIEGIMSSPAYCQYMANIGGNLESNSTLDCNARPQCKGCSKHFRIEYGVEGRRAHWINSNNHIPCQNRHAQACLVQRLFNRLQNMIAYLQQNYLASSNSIFWTLLAMLRIPELTYMYPLSPGQGKDEPSEQGDQRKGGQINPCLDRSI